ncbi:MAG: hypothetical protein ACOCZB_05310 [Spirochaetota bacterium]
MHIFLMLSVPLAYIYLLVLRDEAHQPAALTAVSALKGAIAYLVVLVSLLMVERFVQRPYTGPGLYFYGAVYDFVIPGYLGFLLYLWFTRDPGGLAPEERFVSLLSFFAGLFAFAGLMDVLLRSAYFGAYELFHLPALRIALMVMLPVLSYRYAAETLWLRYLYLALILAVPFALGTAALLLNMNYLLAGTTVTVVLFAGGWASALFAAGGSRSLRYR